MDRSLDDKDEEKAIWELRNIKVDTYIKLISTLSIIGAVAAAIYTGYDHWQQSESNDIAEALLDLKTTVTPIKINGATSLLKVDVHLHNLGKRTVAAYSHRAGTPDEYDGQGVTLSVTQHDLPLPGNRISDGSSDGKRVIERFNILENRYSYDTPGSWAERYAIKPGQSYRETAAVVVKNGALYEVVVRFYGERKGYTWTNSETTYVLVK